MNDSNHTLRFSRTYQEATGRKAYRSDFAEDVPRCTLRGALFWTGATIAIGVLAAILSR